MKRETATMNQPPIAATRERSGAIGLIVCLSIALLAALTIYLLAPPSPVPATAPPEAFSSGRARQYQQAIAQRPHAIGTPEHARVREYIITTLTDLGLRPEIQETTVVDPRAGFPIVAGTVHNVVVRLAGTASTRALLLVAHYDSVLASPGASDDTAAVAAMLESIRALRAGPALKNDVIFLFSDAEETGLMGAKAFVDQHPLAKTVGIVLNFEARGNSGPSLMFQTSVENGWLIREFAQAVPNPVASSLFAAVYRTLPNDTDFSIFNEAGFSGLNFAFIDGYLYYHSPLDTVESSSEGSLQHHGSYALALARHFGNLDLRNTRGPDAVYFNPIGSVLIYYPATWAFPLTILLAIIFVGVVVLGLRAGQLSFGGMVLGFLAFLLPLIITAGLVTLLVPLIGSLHSEFFYHGSTYNSKVYLAGFEALVIAITAALLLLFRRKIQVANLAIGATIWWLVATVLTSLYLPGGTYLFLWPPLFSLLGLGVLFAARDQERALANRFVALLICAIPAILIVTPVIYLLFIALTLRLAVAAAVLTVLLLGLLIPHLTLITMSRRWLLPGVALLIGMGWIGAGILTAGSNSQNPRPDNIMYGLNADTGKAIWASADPELDEWTRQFLTGKVERSPIPDFFPVAPRVFIHGDAPSLEVQAPEVTLLDDQTSNGVRTLRARISSRRHASLLAVYTDPGTKVLGVTINGKRVDRLAAILARNNQPPLGLFYWAPPAEGVELTLEVNPGQTVTLRVVDRTDGLPAGAVFEPRPDSIIPTPSMGIVQFSNSTMVSKSFPLAPQP